MEPILTIDNLNSFGGNMLRQGDKSQLKYRLRDVGNKNLGISSKSCEIKMYGGNYTTVVYETTATVSSDNTVSFTIDKVLPKGTFYLEFTVGDYIFPTDHREFFEITPSGKGIEANVIEIVGKDVLIREVKQQVDADLSGVVDKFNTDTANLMSELSNTYDDLLENGVLQTSINDKLADLETQYSPKLTEVTTQLAQKATKEDIQQLSLSYKESFETLSALKSKYPSGSNSNHVVLSDHMIYTYSDGGWISTGIQALGTGVANGTISINHLSESLSHITNQMLLNEDWVIGAIDASGHAFPFNNRIRTKNVIFLPKGSQINLKIEQPFIMTVNIYKNEGFEQLINVKRFIAETDCFVIVTGGIDDSPITDIESVSQNILIYSSKVPQKLIEDSVVIPIKEKVDNSEGTIVYNGAWEFQDNKPDFHNNTRALTNTEGDFLEYSFVGSGIEVYDSSGPNRANVEVYIDGVYIRTVRRYREEDEFNSFVTGVSNLENGYHKIKLVNRISASNRPYFIFDYFIVDKETKRSFLDMDTASKVKDVNQGESISFWVGSQQEYEAIGIKNPQTIYMIASD